MGMTVLKSLSTSYRRSKKNPQLEYNCHLFAETSKQNMQSETATPGTLPATPATPVASTTPTITVPQTPHHPKTISRGKSIESTTASTNVHDSFILKNTPSSSKLSVTFDQDATTYLEESIFPILLPGIEKLLRTVKRKDGPSEEELADPITWLAQVRVPLSLGLLPVLTPLA
ncbi:hypothetical protein BC829DRAFT_231918 [Chytridium lagenaria]|nr:hypothetical protein BC829DRAFT_231918 [Chytridium lagenaria]